MSLYDGLTVETAPVPELSSVPSSFSASPQPQQPVEVSNVKETEKRDWSASMKSMMASQLMRQQMTRVKAAEGRGGLSRGRGRRRGSGIVKVFNLNYNMSSGPAICPYLHPPPPKNNK